MPPRAKATGRLAALVGSDSEPDLDDLIDSERRTVPDSTRAMAATKKPRGRPPAANKVTKPAPKTAARRSSGRVATAREPSRKALLDKSNTNATRIASKTSKDDDDVDVFDQPEESTRAKAGRGRPKAADTVKGNAHTTHTKRGQQEEIPETQLPDSMDIDEDEEPPADMTEVSVMPDAGARDHELEDDTNDVSIRRRLGSLTKKFESLENRHRDLREVGVKEADRNFDRLRRQTEENNAASSKLISQLKEELAAQSMLVKEGHQAQHELESSEARVDALEDKVAELTASLSQAKAEIKTLSTRLAASRNAEAGMKVPGSALKANAVAGRGMASSEMMQTAQVKEDLYGDLTGLIVRGVKRDDKEDVFDCIQTGRNGTLHFKLAVETVEAADSYEDVQFTYRPQLDADRDGDLMEVLPDYLVEEITFPRPHASKFYARVVKSLTERLE